MLALRCPVTKKCITESPAVISSHIINVKDISKVFKREYVYSKG